MKPTNEQIQKLMDEAKDIGGLSLEIIYNQEQSIDKAKIINKKAYEVWVRLSKILNTPSSDS